MNIFIEHRGSSGHPWLCLLAETLDEKRKLEELYLQGSGNDYAIDNSIEWQQQGHKLMFMLEVDQVAEVSGD